MKKVIALALALIMVFALCACGGAPVAEAPAEDSSAADSSAAEAPAGENVVKIGVFEPLTGDSGAGGKQEYLGMQYANYLTPTVEIGGVEYTVQLSWFPRA